MNNENEQEKAKECAMCKWACLEDAALHCHRHAPRIMDRNGFAVFPRVKYDYFCNEYESKAISQEAK